MNLELTMRQCFLMSVKRDCLIKYLGYILNSETRLQNNKMIIRKSIFSTNKLLNFDLGV